MRCLVRWGGAPHACGSTSARIAASTAAWRRVKTLVSPCTPSSHCQRCMRGWSVCRTIMSTRWPSLSGTAWRPSVSTASMPASSLLAIDEAVRDTWSDGHLLHEERVIEVPTTRLDSFLQRYNIQHVEFLKIDAQGADFAVLRSAGDRLADIDRIQLEVAITLRQLYAGAADRETILAYMVGQGFELVETEAKSSGQKTSLSSASLPGRLLTAPVQRRSGRRIISQVVCTRLLIR